MHTVRLAPDRDPSLHPAARILSLTLDVARRARACELDPRHLHTHPDDRVVNVAVRLLAVERGGVDLVLLGHRRTG